MNINHSPKFSAPTAQRGAVLIVSLLLLIVMTVLALSMSQTARLHERMAGNNREYELAFQASESALRSAEWAVMNSAYLEECDGQPTSDPAGCKFASKGLLADTNLGDAPQTWWTDHAKEFGSTTQDMAGLYADPRYVIEKAGSQRIGGLDIGQGAEQTVQYYRVTASGFGRSAESRAVNSSVVAAQPE